MKHTYKYNSAKKSAANPHPIEVTETAFSFPQGASGQVTVAFSNIKEVWQNDDKDKDEDEGKQLIIYTHDNQRYEFHEDRFDTPAAFADFEQLVSSNAPSKPD